MLYRVPPTPLHYLTESLLVSVVRFVSSRTIEQLICPWNAIACRRGSGVRTMPRPWLTTDNGERRVTSPLSASDNSQVITTVKPPYLLTCLLHFFFKISKFKHRWNLILLHIVPSVTTIERKMNKIFWYPNLIAASCFFTEFVTSNIPPHLIIINVFFNVPVYVLWII